VAQAFLPVWLERCLERTSVAVAKLTSSTNAGSIALREEEFRSRHASFPLAAIQAPGGSGPIDAVTLMQVENSQSIAEDANRLLN